MTNKSIEITPYDRQLYESYKDDAHGIFTESATDRTMWVYDRDKA